MPFNKNEVLDALALGNADEVKNLLSSPEAKNQLRDEGYSLLISAIEKGFPKVANVLLEFDEIKENASLNDNKALQKAIEKHDVDTLRTLLTIENVKTSVSHQEILGCAID